MAAAKRKELGSPAMQEMLELMDASAKRHDDVVAAQPGVLVYQRLRATHHLLARAIAEGRGDVAAAALSGYDLAQVRGFKSDPGFKELIAYYSAQCDAIAERYSDRIAALGLAALDELQHRIETTPEEIPTKDLLRIGESLLDRTIAPSKGGAGTKPAGSQLAIAVNVQFAQGSREAPVIELRPEPAA